MEVANENINNNPTVGEYLEDNKLKRKEAQEYLDMEKMPWEMKARVMKFLKELDTHEDEIRSKYGMPPRKK